MLPDSQRTQVRIDDDVFDDRERLQRMTKMWHDDHVAGTDDFACGRGDQNRVMAVASESIECHHEPRPWNPQAQVIVEMKLIVEFPQPGKIGFACAADLNRGRIVGGICSAHQVSYDGAPRFESSNAIARSTS